MKIEERIKDSQNQFNGVGVILIDAQESLLSGIVKKDDLIDALLLLIQSILRFLQVDHRPSLG